MQAERLSPEEPKGYAIVRSEWRHSEGGITRLPARDGHKVTECLNECAARLGVSLRQTEDQLTRDMLAGTAAFINCVGGFNGDNPTEITRSDVDVVVRTLLNNNAYTIMDNIEGEDKFGKVCAEVKSALIEVEAVA